MEESSILSKKFRKAQVWIAHQAHGKPPEVLLFRVTDIRGGGWHPVTGGVDKDESFLEGAKREVLEETGIEKDDGKWIDLKYSYHFTGRYGDAEEHAFALILKSARLNPKLDPKEHLEFKWVPIDKASKELNFEPQRNALEKVSCYFKKA